MLELKLELNRNSMPRTSSLSMIDMQRKMTEDLLPMNSKNIYFGTAGFLNALTNRPKSLSPPRTRKRKDTLSTMDVESDLKLISYIGAVVKTYSSSVLLSYMPLFSETKMSCF